MSLSDKKKLLIKDQAPILTDKAGLVWTIDDSQRLPTWLTYSTNYGLDKGFRGTHFVNEIYGGYVAMANTLISRGNEFANHTFDHYCDVNSYINGGGTPEGYYNDHLLLTDNWLESVGFDLPSHFAWPCGADNQTVFDWLVNNNKSRIIRKYSTRDYPPNYLTNGTVEGLDGYYSGGNYAGGYTMEQFYGDFAVDMTMQKQVLDYALSNNICIIYISHDVKPRGTFNPATELATATEDLNTMIDYANEIGLPIRTVSEMWDLFN